MRFEQIETLLLEHQNWYQVDSTNEFLHKSDIFFKMVFKEPLRINSVSGNIQTFLNQLKDRQTNNVIDLIEVEFKYKEQTLKTVDLYRFYGKLGSDENKYQNVYFAKPSDKLSEDSIEDPFHLSLIHMKNDSRGLSFINYAHGNLE